jgi:hypothetical protein
MIVDVAAGHAAIGKVDVRRGYAAGMARATGI